MKKCIICKKEILNYRRKNCGSQKCLQKCNLNYSLKSYYKNKEKNREKRRNYSQSIQNNPELKKRKNKNNKIWRDKIKLKILIRYGGNPPKCACCEEKQIKFLTIDHINNDGANHRKKIGRGSKIYFWLYKKKIMSNIQILCFNCNASKGIYGECPHKSFGVEDIKFIKNI